MLYEYSCKKYPILKKEVRQLEEELKHLPEGDMYVCHNGKYKKYYMTDGKCSTYIPRKDYEMAKALAVGKYKRISLEEKAAELKLMEQITERLGKKQVKRKQMLAENSAYGELLSEAIKEHMKSEWSNQVYEKNPNFKEHLVHRTLEGEFVRSKSEVIIANSLFLNHIPYRYECALQLGDVTLYPDFTIMHPQTE